MPRVRYVVGAATLTKRNAGLDAEASAERFAAALREAFARELPGVEISVEVASDPAAWSRYELQGRADEPAAEATLRVGVEAVVDAVRGCVDWAVYD